MPLLGISIDGCRIWTLAGKSRQKIVKEVAALKIDGCMHPLPKIEGGCVVLCLEVRDHLVCMIMD